ncbi:hypothetical protein BGZ83_007552 [Gryganskiella cystojenkinii]|nr:hypothetical protein BGZ83_007552 [Gryganskiella cystojenkinii]
MALIHETASILGKHINGLDPLAIPEILSAIGRWLPRRALLASTQVSKSWHKTLSPLLWSNVVLLLPSKTLDVPKIEKNSAFIRRLEVRGDFTHPDITNLTCPGLKEFTWSHCPNNVDLVLPFIRRHPTLRSISLMISGSISEELLRAIASCQNLARFKSLDMFLDKNGLWQELYEKVWSRLKILTLEGYWFCSEDEVAFPYHPPSESELTQLSARVGGSTKIQELSIRSGEDDYGEKIMLAHLWVIRQCPDLLRLEWYSKLDDPAEAPMRYLADEYRSGGQGWPKLESLELEGMPFCPEDLQVLAESMPRLVELDLNETLFSLDSWRALQNVPMMLTQLRVLKVQGSDELPGSAIQEILCSLPKLEILHARKIATEDILNDNRPWVCENLRFLYLGFELNSPLPQPPSPSSPSAMIMSRLSKLVKLEALTLNIFEFKKTGAAQLGFTLSEDLDQLRTLGRLQIVCGPPYGKGFARIPWSSDEVTWVENHWPALRDLSGFEMKEREDQDRMDRLLKKNKEQESALIL